jgi:hypothetical protein
MHSRHASTRRNMKRCTTEPWMGEIIVVKEYDQMDSLREILELPARIQRTPTEDNESEAVEHVVTELEVSESKSTPPESTKGVEQGIEQKNEKEKENDDEAIVLSIQNPKRRRVMSPGSLCHQQTPSPETRHETPKVVDTEKDYISPIEVLHLTVIIKDSE